MQKGANADVAVLYNVMGGDQHAASRQERGSAAEVTFFRDYDLKERPQRTRYQRRLGQAGTAQFRLDPVLAKSSGHSRLEDEEQCSLCASDVGQEFFGERTQLERHI